MNTVSALIRTLFVISLVNCGKVAKSNCRKQGFASVSFIGKYLQHAYLGPVKLLVPHDLVEVIVLAIKLTEELGGCSRSKILDLDWCYILGKIEDNLVQDGIVFSQSVNEGIIVPLFLSQTLDH